MPVLDTVPLPKSFLSYQQGLAPCKRMVKNPSYAIRARAQVIKVQHLVVMGTSILAVMPIVTLELVHPHPSGRDYYSVPKIGRAHV